MGDSITEHTRLLATEKAFHDHLDALGCALMPLWPGVNGKEFRRPNGWQTLRPEDNAKRRAVGTPPLGWA
uniref:hypothetical protein n=1 Tax=Aldersonia kunmingensis TaxID=408066 RepID=UPI000AE05992